MEPELREAKSRAAIGGPIEQGEAFVRLGPAERTDEPLDVVVIGAGQAGLSVGYHLARRQLRFAILDAADRIGDSWRNRWDSLRLFTPARYDGLDGMRFPASASSFPTKDEMADYLEDYAARFSLPVFSGTRVDRLSFERGRYLLDTTRGSISANQVVVAMSNYQSPRVPDFAGRLDRRIVQLHSSEYRNPSQLLDGDVLVVGAGNSGAEIAYELAKTHRVRLSGRSTGHLPFRVGGLLGRWFLTRLVLRILFHRVLTCSTALGRKMRPAVTSKGGPLIRVKPNDLAKAGVERVGRVVGAVDGSPQLDDGRALEVSNIVWCTGFHPGFSWIDLPAFGRNGEPLHEAGVSKESPGLYFLGLHFLYSVSSVMIHGVGRDAARIATAIEKRKSAVHRGASTE